MQRCYTIYLGARNTDHRTITAADYKKIEEIVSKTSKNYTLIRAQGYWQGQLEDTAVIVLALTNDERAVDRIQKCCGELLREFKQYAVMCQLSGTAVVIKEKTLKATKAVKTAEENSARNAWAKKMLKQYPNQKVAAVLKDNSALSKLENLKAKNPQAEFPEALARLKKDFPHLVK
jgi:hypothetical protein